jgi:phage host-nuclease inhibitor protein Gam
MRFLFRIFVFGFIALAVLPAFAPEEYRVEAETSDETGAPSAFAVAALVGQAAADIRSVCDRQPEMCETGGEILSYAGSKAREGLVIAYAMFRHGHPSMKESAEEQSEIVADAS